MTVHAQGVQNQHGQLILEWSEPKKQQYTISGTNVTGGELSVEKDGDNIIPSGDDQINYINGRVPVMEQTGQI